MWVVLCHSKICCFCPSWWPLLLIRGGPKKQQSIPTTHFVGKHHIYMQKGHPFRINILCFKKQQSVPKTHFIDKYYIYSHKGHLFRINILCRLHRMLILSATSSLTYYWHCRTNATHPFIFLHRSMKWNQLFFLFFLFLFHSDISSDKEQLQDFEIGLPFVMGQNSSQRP